MRNMDYERKLSMITDEQRRECEAHGCDIIFEKNDQVFAIN